MHRINELRISLFLQKDCAHGAVNDGEGINGRRQGDDQAKRSARTVTGKYKKWPQIVLVEKMFPI